MITAKSLIKKIEDVRGLGELATTYEFIAASAMRRIRNSVLENRAFHLGLNAVFQHLRRAYERELSLLTRTRHFSGQKKTLSVIQRDRASAIVLLSANASLYGEVILKTFSAFVNEVKKDGADIVIIGRIGRTLFEQEMPGKKYIYFDFPDTTIAVENLKAISRYLNQYERVVVFHGQFKSLISQESVQTAISGETLEAASAETPPEDIRYIFEPSLETIIIFFETEIFGSLLEQVFHESRLAKLASRMILLDRASVNVTEALKHMTSERQRFEHRVFNRKQIDALSGVSLWFAS